MYKKKILCYLVVMAMLAAMIPARSEAAKVKLSTTKVTVKVGQKKTVKITGLKSKNIKKLTIKVTKGSKLVKVKKSGKTKFIIQGKKKGKATVKATFKTKKKNYTFKCAITVNPKKAAATAKPTTKPTVKPTTKPTATPKPSMIPYEDNSLAGYVAPVVPTISDAELDGTYDDTATQIALASTGTTATGANASAVEIEERKDADSAACVTIKDAGTYVVSGTLTRGQLKVSAEGKDVHVILKNANISNDLDAAFYVSKAASVKVSLEGTNELNDNNAAGVAEEPKDGEATFLSKKSIPVVINAVKKGEGSLIVKATRYKAIMVKDVLKIANASIQVTYANHNAISGSMDLVITQSAISTYDVAGDALKSGKAGIYVTDTELNLQANQDGFDAEGTEKDGDIYISASGNVNASRPEGSDSTDGCSAVRAARMVLIENTDCSFVGADDGITAGSYAKLINDKLVVAGEAGKGIYALQGINIEESDMIVRGNTGICSYFVTVDAGKGILDVDGKTAGIATLETMQGLQKTPTFILKNGVCNISSQSGNALESTGDAFVYDGYMDLSGSVDEGTYPAECKNFYIYAGRVFVTGMRAQSGLTCLTQTGLVDFGSSLPAGTKISVTSPDLNVIFSETLSQASKYLYVAAEDMEYGVTYTVSVDGVAKYKFVCK